MSINSMNSRFAMAEKMSIPQIQQSVQSGSLPAYVGVPLLEQKMKEQQKAAAMAQLAQAQQQAQQFGIPSQTPIAQGIMDKASGIDDMPSNLPVAGYNDGGIVAFAEGGDAEDFDYEEYQDEQDAEEYNNMLRAYMAEAEAAGIEGIPVHRTKKVEMGVEKKADGGIIGLNEGGIPRFQSRGLVSEASEDMNQGSYANISPEYDPVGIDVMERLRIGDPDAYARMMSSTNTVPEDASPGARPSPFMTGETGGRASLGYRRPPPGPLSTTPKGRELPPEPLPLSALDFDAQSPTTLPTVVVTPEPDSQSNTASYNDAIDSTMSGNGIRNLNPAVAPAGGNKNVASGGDRVPGGSAPTRERPKSAFEDFIANIKEERAALNKQKQDDKYMALLTAGLGMMSGTSPNAFANIGQGAQAGVAQYGASAKQRAAERAALNKNLLMGQRYQSMEDIAARTADINEARYKDALAARAAGAGDAASLKQERVFDQREAALARAIQQGQATVANALKAQFGDTGMLTNKADYDKAYRDLTAEYVTPHVLKRNQLDRQRFPDIFDQSPQQTPPPSGGNRLRVDKNGNIIQ